jgi:hypothetical protein
MTDRVPTKWVLEVPHPNYVRFAPDFCEARDPESNNTARGGKC